MVGGCAYRIAEHPQPSWEVVGRTTLSNSLASNGVLVHHILAEEVPFLQLEVGIPKATASMTIVHDLQENLKRLGGGSVSPSIGEGIGKSHLGHVE